MHFPCDYFGKLCNTNGIAYVACLLLKNMFEALVQIDKNLRRIIPQKLAIVVDEPKAL